MTFCTSISVGLHSPPYMYSEYGFCLKDIQIPLHSADIPAPTKQIFAKHFVPVRGWKMQECSQITNPPLILIL